MGSPKFKLDMRDVLDLFKNAALVGSATAVAFLAQNIGDLDVGSVGALLIPAITVGLDALVKLIKDNTKKLEE